MRYAVLDLDTGQLVHQSQDWEGTTCEFVHAVKANKNVALIKIMMTTVMAKTVAPLIFDHLASLVDYTDQESPYPKEPLNGI